MTERNLYDDEFERLLKEKVDQYKMYPSDKVWNNVNSSLHTKRRRFVAGMTLLIGTFLILAGAQLLSPSQPAHQGSAASKLNETMKSAPAEELQASAPNGFVAIAGNRSKDAHHSAQDINSGTPFSGITLVSAEDESVQNEISATQTGKIQSASDLNIIQSSSAITAEKSGPLVFTPALKEPESASVAIPTMNGASADLTPEKTITHLSHTRNDRFSWEIYITPTLNSRYLTGLNAQAMRQSYQNSPIMVVRFANVNGFVDNTPAMGYNLGGNLVYKIAKNISLKAGLEFSYSRYYIKAYNANPSQSSATLNPYLGYIPDSVMNYNGGGGILNSKNPQHYQNKYYQLSMPLGVEMKVLGNGKLQLHLGATIQPSYLLNTDAYVLSEDYNSYFKDAPVFRRWNLNAGAEAFISYGVGKIRWELGPQVRYQIFSTYKNSYPFNENLLNYGIRIGFSKTIW
jgi:hypothetical protein